MLPKSRKFPLRREFLRFRSRAQKFLTPHLTLYYSAASSPSRLSVVVPLKVSKLAVARNWLKRLTYDTLWSDIKDKSVDCVVVYKPFPLRKSVETKSAIIAELKSYVSALPQT